MYHIPELYETIDYLCPVPRNEVEFCREEETIAITYTCDQDLFELCCLIIEENNIPVPGDLYHATGLYLN
ncbi:hypothetical protein HOLleu_12777 [Holothuria leucospilota]|uniref:Uncharacterized protein n=1 Tax=Holothuria leucospilota TaxID=206669 RepID=A0A9Q1CBW7_HOLLE|nr:hypothetical protein HOLleu_12777 [Holothuria leucospilota]